MRYRTRRNLHLILRLGVLTSVELGIACGAQVRANETDEPATASRAAADAEPFDLLEIRVLGASALAQRDVESAVYPLLGPNRTIRDVQAARDALVKAYRDRGFAAVYVDIPEQQVRDGVVHLQVSEGRLDRVRVSGARYFSNGRIRTELAALRQGEVLNAGTLQDELAAVNRESRDRSVTPVLRAGQTPGTVDLDLNVTDKLPIHGNVEVSNRYTANTPAIRTGASLSYDNLFQSFQSLSLQYQTAPESPSATRVVAGTYLIPIDGSHQIALYGVNTSSDVSTVGALSVLGAGSIIGGRYIVSLDSEPSRFQTLTFGIDYKDFDTSIQLTNALDRSPIKYLAWSLNYAGNLATPATLTSLSFTSTFGVRGLVNKSDQFDYNRYLANPNFFYLRSSVQHDRPLFLGSRLYLRVGAQYSPSPLINNEQLAVGGADTVRGYLEADALGDVGYDATVEWRSPGFGSHLGPSWNKAYVFAFFDKGFVRFIDPLPTQVASERLDSLGLGARLAGWAGLSLGLDFAHSLKATSNTRAGDSRVLFDFIDNF